VQSKDLMRKTGYIGVRPRPKALELIYSIDCERDYHKRGHAFAEGDDKIV